MDLFIYFEFCRPDIIDAFKKIYPNIKVIQSDSLNDKYASIESLKIYRTNAKLFGNNVDKDILKSIGFKINPEHQFAICKEKRTILVPSQKHVVQYRKCECGKTEIEIPPQMEEKIIIVNVKRDFTDRIILEVDEL